MATQMGHKCPHCSYVSPDLDAESTEGADEGYIWCPRCDCQFPREHWMPTRVRQVRTVEIRNIEVWVEDSNSNAVSTGEAMAAAEDRVGEGWTARPPVLRVGHYEIQVARAEMVELCERKED